MTFSGEPLVATMSPRHTTPYTAVVTGEAYKAGS